MNNYWWKYFQVMGKLLALVLCLALVFWMIDNRKSIWQFLLGEIVEQPKNPEKIVNFDEVSDEKVGVILEKIDEKSINQVGFGLLINDQQVLIPAHILKSGKDYFFYNNVFDKREIGVKVFERQSDLAVGLLSESVAVKTLPKWAREIKLNEEVWLWINEEKTLKRVEGKIVNLAKKIKLQKPWGEISIAEINLIEVEVKSNLGDSGGAVFNQVGEVIGLLVGVDVEHENIGYIMRVDQEKIPLMTESQ